MKRYIFSALIIIIGLLVLFAPFGFAHVCHPKADGSFMKCHWMGEAVRLLGGLISVYNIGTGVSLILLETLVIGTCKHPNMSCNVYTKPIVILLAIALIAVSLVYVFLSRKEKFE